VEALLIIIAIGFLFLLAAHPELETRIVLVPVEVVKKSEGGSGCLPLIIVAIILLVAFASTQP